MFAPYEFKPQDARDFARFMHIKSFERNGELHFQQCPYCHQLTADKKTFAISLETGQFKCLRESCGAQGNMITLAKDFDFSLGNAIDEYYKPKKEFKTFKKPEQPIIPKDPALKYLQSRGIGEAVARKYQITVQNGDETKLVIPFFDEKGNMPFIKYRKTDFVKGRDKDKEWCQAGGKPILFGMQQCNLAYKTLVLTEGQCFDGKAEVLTPNGWLRLEEYNGQDVLQVDSNLQGTFVRPKQYIVKRHIGKMVKVEVGGNYETYTTDDHNLVFYNNKGCITKKQAGEKIPTNWHIPTTININSDKHSNWTDEMFALYIAVSADGTIDYRKKSCFHKAQTERYVRIAIPLERKINRMREILNTLGIEYSDNADSRGYRSICFHCPEWLESKYLPYWFATETTLAQKRFILDEMVKWDGNTVPNRNQYEYVTILKHNANVMQLIATTCGYMSTIISKQNGGNANFKKSYCYKVSILFEKHDISTQQFEKNKTVTEVDQRVYCVTVDTGMILIRQNNRISVSGNCDALSCAQAGINNPVSVPTGAKGFTWVPYCWDWIVNNFDTIIVFGDHENGHISLLDDIRQRFHKMRIMHVREEDYKDCKDANDILRKYGEEYLRTCIANAVELPLTQVLDLADVEDVNIYDLEKLGSGIAELDDALNGGIPFGGVTIVTGKSGKGKSSFASQILANAIDQGYKCFAYSGELPNHLFKSWLYYQLAGKAHIQTYTTKKGREGYKISDTNKRLIREWHKGKIFIYDSSNVDNENHSLLDTVEETIIRYGVKVVLIDNLMTGLDLEYSKETDKYERQSKFVKALARIGMRYDVLIILVAHKRKNMGNETDTMDEVSGSSDITNLGLITLSYDMGSTKELKDGMVLPTQRKLKLVKNRLFGTTNADGWILSFEPKSKRIYGEKDDPNKEYSWTKNLDDGFDDATDEDLNNLPWS